MGKRKPFPRPWETMGDPVQCGKCYVCAISAPPPRGMNDDVCAAKAMGRTPQEAQANADYIVEAVNAYERLKTGCELALGFAVNARETWPDWQDHLEIGVLFAKMKTALGQQENRDA